MQVVPGFLPSAKGAGGYIGAHAFSGLAVKCPFPVMDNTCAVGSQMRDPASIHEFI